MTIRDVWGFPVEVYGNPGEDLWNHEYEVLCGSERDSFRRTIWRPRTVFFCRDCGACTSDSFTNYGPDDTPDNWRWHCPANDADPHCDNTPEAVTAAALADGTAGYYVCHCIPDDPRLVRCDMDFVDGGEGPTKCRGWEPDIVGRRWTTCPNKRNHI